MREYNVQIKETLAMTVTVEAKSAAHAREIVEQGWKDQEYGDYGIKVIMLYVSLNLTAALFLNYREILGSCLFAQFFFCINIFQMQSNIIGRCLKQVRYKSLS